jgi:hypothetical protein
MVKKRADNKALHKYFKAHFKFQVFRKNYFVRVRSKFAKLMNIRDFSEDLNNFWFIKNGVIKALRDGIQHLVPFVNNVPNDTFYTRKLSKESKIYSFRFINLMRVIYYIGAIFEFNNIAEIKGDRLITFKSLNTAMNSFGYKFSEKLNQDIDREHIIRSPVRFQSDDEILRRLESI